MTNRPVSVVVKKRRRAVNVPVSDEDSRVWRLDFCLDRELNAEG